MRRPPASRGSEFKPGVFGSVAPKRPPIPLAYLSAPPTGSKTLSARLHRHSDFIHGWPRQKGDSRPRRRRLASAAGRAGCATPFAAFAALMTAAKSNDWIVVSLHHPLSRLRRFSVLCNFRRNDARLPAEREQVSSAYPAIQAEPAGVRGRSLQARQEEAVARMPRGKDCQVDVHGTFDDGQTKRAQDFFILSEPV